MKWICDESLVLFSFSLWAFYFTQLLKKYRYTLANGWISVFKDCVVCWGYTQKKEMDNLISFMVNTRKIISNLPYGNKLSTLVEALGPKLKQFLYKILFTI